MTREELLTGLRKKQEVGFYVEQVLEKPELVPLLLDILEDEPTAAKYLAEKVIRQISLETPELLAPHFERLALLLHHENSFIRWGVLLTLPRLLPVVDQVRWEKAEERFLSFLYSDSVVAFGNTLKGVPLLLENRPELEDRILKVFLQIDHRLFLHKGEPSPECLDVAKEHLLDCFDRLYPSSSHQKEMIAFAQNNLENHRSQVRAKAKRFLKKWRQE